ncbi:MAG: hypothetical protein O2816_11595 [Planctomycetota bacterium]|nr:hypothetical protein [Planctomycetota bacterium]
MPWPPSPPLEVARAADDANREQVLRDLEAGVHALREVGATEVAQQVVRVMERVQAELRQEGENLADLEMRLQVLRVAHKAFTEAGD